jgi:hypothetical protein
MKVVNCTTTCVVTRPAIIRPSGELIAAPIAASAPPTTSSGLGVSAVPTIGTGTGAPGAMRATWEYMPCTGGALGGLT